MLTIVLAALAAASSTTAAAASAAPPTVIVSPSPAPGATAASSAATKAANQAAQMAMFADMAVKALDRVLPPQPEPDPARLALARTTMNGFLPAGSYPRMANVMTDNLMNGVYNRLMGMTGTELSNAIGLPISSGADAALTLRQQASKGDPLFDARIKAYTAAFKEEMRQTMGVMEPRMREGMARAMARRFDAAQLTDLNRFFATDTGRAFGQDMILLFIDGDVFRGMFAAMPDLMRAMPQSAARFAAIEKQYPWPKKAEVKKAAPVKKKK
ncbi:MAG: hypothetical protein ABIR87_02585 [Sphingomicrobium sp.]